MAFIVTEIQLLILIGIFGAMGAGIPLFMEWLSPRNKARIAEVYDERNNQFFQVARKGLPFDDDTFNVGEHQFVWMPEKTTTYERWNRYGGRLPVVRYNIADGKAMDVDQEERIAPNKWKFTRITKPTSATTNLIFRRGGAKAMLQSTNRVSMDPRLAFIAGVAVAGPLLLIAGILWHPGFTLGPPPPGFFWHLDPVPTNATVVG